MTHQTEQEHISKKRVVYTLPNMNAVTVRRDQPYREFAGGALTLDVYYPPGVTMDARTPAVIFVTGFSDEGAQRMVGCTFKDMGSYVSWATLAAASGLVAITYENRDPATDARAICDHVRRHATSIGIDEQRLGLWSCSGNVPTALSLLMGGGAAAITCAVLCYGYTFDVDGSTRVADAAKQFRFANPAAGKSVDDLPANVPLFVARAGQDAMPGLNEALDQFVLAAVTRNLPITFVNHAAGPHAFDLFDDSEASRAIIRSILTFMREHLRR
jgi:hypothetical protein